MNQGTKGTQTMTNSRQFSILQIMLVMTVLAIFIINNCSPLTKVFSDGSWIEEEGWPIVHTIRSARSQRPGSVEFRLIRRTWARYANILLCGVACVTTAYAVPYLSRRFRVVPASRLHEPFLIGTFFLSTHFFARSSGT